MPNMKIYIDADRNSEAVAAVRNVLRPLRVMLCRELDVGVTACQFAVVNVFGLGDQAQVNVEILILPRPERTRDRIIEVCTLIRAMVADATGLQVVVRSSFLDPETYVAMK
ncbi:hypothetical protein [Agrobacterium tumefaciens]|uniref:Uncharacterized protein n=1 Tax=Agrobacterium tumefaciens TaxID=358 RepID=A0A2L2LM35_AGRTU|nr:hypothetical protein [Agrobacterium tumefaciens]AVH45389.1 hypothetical protein At1D1609_53570 [Agrobacterium tumefaciens]NSY99118.1 hypothetical protein [Agrobacterium tumefaciens]